jgi:superoxide dismutase, Cu-Zn family
MSHRGVMRKTTNAAIKATIAATAIAAAGSATARAQEADPTPAGTAHPASTVATFEPYQPGVKAVTYDEQLVPAGAGVQVESTPNENGTTTTQLHVNGLVPNRTYGSHAHQKGCGADPAAAGPHYQNIPDPVQPSLDPAYANPHNEIWLDFTTNDQGDAYSVSTVDWQFTDRHAQSVVVHVNPTPTGPGVAGDAGARLGCVNVDF